VQCGGGNPRAVLFASGDGGFCRSPRPEIPYLLVVAARSDSLRFPSPPRGPTPLTRVATSPRFPPRRSLQSLASCSEKVKNFAIIYCVDIDEVRAHRVLPFVLESRVLSTGKVWLLLAALCPSLNLVSRAACASPQYSRHAVGAG